MCFFTPGCHRQTTRITYRGFLTKQDDLSLVDLPKSYTELYGRAKSAHAYAAVATAEGGSGASAQQDVDPAVCLVCGQVKLFGGNYAIVVFTAG